MQSIQPLMFIWRGVKNTTRITRDNKRAVLDAVRIPSDHGAESRVGRMVEILGGVIIAQDDVTKGAMAVLDKQALEGGADADEATVDGAVGGGDVVYGEGVEMVFEATEEGEVEVSTRLVPGDDDEGEDSDE